MNRSSKLMWSEKLEQHFLCIKNPETGFIFEDGTFISQKRFERDLQFSNLTDRQLKFYMAGLNIFKDKGYMLI